MANSVVTFASIGSPQSSFSFSFSYLAATDIDAFVDGTSVFANNASTGTAVGGNTYTVAFSSSGSKTLTFSPAVPQGSTVRIERNTDLTSKAVDFSDGAVLTELALDSAIDQVFFATQESNDKTAESIIVTPDGKFDATSKVIKNVADPVDNTDAVNKQFISTNLPNITTVAGISGDVTTVAGIQANVTTVATDQADIGTVSSNIASVNTVATNIADVVTVANDLNEAISEIETAANDLNETTSEIDTVANAIANVNTVGTNISNVNTVAGVSSNVTTVAGNNANVSTVAGISSDVTTVAGIQANVTAVAGDATDIGTVATNLAGTDTIGTVAGNITNVNTVAGNNANINTVAGVSANVTTVAGISANVSTVATNNANVTAVAGNATNINTVAGAATNINTVASNLTNVNSFANTYFIGTSAPSSPTTGDLWFDSTPSVLTMKVYNGSGFVNAGSSVNGTAARESYIVGTNSGSYTGSTTVFPATYDAGFVDVYLNGVKLHGADFTATNGTSITLAAAATSGDTLDVLSFGTFTLANIAANQLTDVYTTGVADGQILQYSSSNSRFEPVTFQGGAGYFVGENGTTGNTSTGLGDIFRVHEAALDTATTIPSNTNALAAGPLTLNAALTVNGTVTVV